jgi:phosphoribosylformylglycinamidine synthase
LAVALAESCVSGEVKRGAEISVDVRGRRTDELLFNESQSRILISSRPGSAAELQLLADRHKVDLIELGQVGGQIVQITAGQRVIRWDVDELFDSWYFSIERAVA